MQALRSEFRTEGLEAFSASTMQTLGITFFAQHRLPGLSNPSKEEGEDEMHIESKDGTMVGLRRSVNGVFMSIELDITFEPASRPKKEVGIREERSIINERISLFRSRARQ